MYSLGSILARPAVRLLTLWRVGPYLTKNYVSGSDPQTIALIVIGAVLLILGGINETLTKRSAIIPPRLFKVLFFSFLPTLYADSISVDTNNNRYPDNLLIACDSLLCHCILPPNLLPSPRFECYWCWN